MFDQNVFIVTGSISLLSLLLSLYAVYRSSRRTNSASEESADNKAQPRAQRPIWRPK